MSGSALSFQARRPGTVRLWSVSLLAVLLSLFSAPFGVMGGPLRAQGPAQKRPLTIAEYKLWRSISGATMSPDGKWAAWSYTLVRGDDTLHVVNLDTDAEHVVPLASGAEFSDDGEWVAYFLSPPFVEAEKARREDDPVVRKAELLNLTSGEKRSWDGAASFGFAKGSSHFFVKKGSGDSGGGGGRSGGGQAAGRSGGGGDGPRGTDLILRNLREGYDELIGSVDEAGFNKPGTLFAYTVDAADKDGNGLYLVNLANGGQEGFGQRQGTVFEADLVRGRGRPGRPPRGGPGQEDRAGRTPWWLSRPWRVEVPCATSSMPHPAMGYRTDRSSARRGA